MDESFKCRWAYSFNEIHRLGELSWHLSNVVDLSIQPISKVLKQSGLKYSAFAALYLAN